MIGVDKTQSIALDEIFGRKTTNAEGRITTSKVFRKTNIKGTDATASLIIKEDPEDEYKTVGGGTTERPSTVNDSDGVLEKEEDEDYEIEVELKNTIVQGKGLCSGRVAVNLIVMSWMWVASNVCYNIINFYMKYIPGSEYLNFTLAGISEILGHIFVGVLFRHLGPRMSYIIGFAVATAGSVVLIWQNKFVGNTALIASTVLMAKFGASICLCTCYVATPFIFPVVICGTAFGICNLFGRTLSIAAPIIAELKIPLPMECFAAMAVISIFVAMLIKPADKM